MAAWHITGEITFIGSRPRDFQVITVGLLSKQVVIIFKFQIRNFSRYVVDFAIQAPAIQNFHIMSQIGKADITGCCLHPGQSFKFLVGRTENSFAPGINHSQILIQVT
jgi:hypothetical protein